MSGVTEAGTPYTDIGAFSLDSTIISKLQLPFTRNHCDKAKLYHRSIEKGKTFIWSIEKGNTFICLAHRGDICLSIKG